MGVRPTGNSGAHLELKGKGGSQKGGKWEQETSELGMGEGACGNCSSSDSGLVFTPQPFPPPHKPQPLCERKLGFVVPVSPGDKGVGVSRGLVRAVASHFRVINASPRGRKGWIGGFNAVLYSVVIRAKQNLARF